MKAGHEPQRQFALAFAVLLAVVGALPLLRRGSPRWLPLSAAVALVAIGFVFPRLLAGPARWWMALAALLNRVTSAVILTIVYFVVILPTGLYMRLAGKDALERRFDRNTTTYWSDREESSPDIATLRRQY